MDSSLDHGQHEITVHYYSRHGHPPSTSEVLEHGRRVLDAAVASTWVNVSGRLDASIFSTSIPCTVYGYSLFLISGIRQTLYLYAQIPPSVQDLVPLRTTLELPEWGSFDAEEVIRIKDLDEFRSLIWSDNSNVSPAVRSPIISKAQSVADHPRPGDDFTENEAPRVKRRRLDFGSLWRSIPQVCQNR